MSRRSLLQAGSLVVPPERAALSGLDAKGPGQNTRVLCQFRSQLARRESTAVDVVLMGHSLIEGEGATAMAKRGNDRFRDIMRTRFPVAGVTGGYGYIPIRVASTTWSLSPYITTSGGTASSAYGFGIGSYFVNAAAAKVVLSTIACTAIDVIYIQGGGGTFSTKVDGVANGDSVATVGSPTKQKAYRVPG
ncbi:MAG: hypothetical protein JWM31_3447, partial [Solirubrobacterales bacterium]|nr:hypothetical protein [Solirubrobacterales bacterium]